MNIYFDHGQDCRPIHPRHNGNNKVPKNHPPRILFSHPLDPCTPIEMNDLSRPLRRDRFYSGEEQKVSIFRKFPVEINVF